MIEIAIPGEYLFDVPANANVIGNNAAVPNPTRQNPIKADQNFGNNTATKIPKMMTNELNI